VTYEYNAMGERVAKDTAGVPQALFLHDGAGNQIAELNAARQPQHVNVYAGSHLIGMLESDGVHYAYSDWLGTKRYETGPQGGAVNSWATLPFGDSLTPQVTGGLDATEQHFTGKEHDAESGLDYFGARYYQAQTGRGLLPDWSATPVPVPYAVFSNPQSLNLYTYVGNNPVNAIDADGHVQEPGGNIVIGQGAKPGFGMGDGGCVDLNVCIVVDDIGGGIPLNPILLFSPTATPSTPAAGDPAQQQNTDQTQQNQGTQSNGNAHFEYFTTQQKMYKFDDQGNYTLVGEGYSGKGEGLNNPFQQAMPGAPGKADAGPIPSGNYTIGTMFDNKGKTGPGSMRLTPDAGNDMHGRSGFLIHGDNSKHNFSASEGCVILPRGARDAISSSGITRLEVYTW